MFTLAMPQSLPDADRNASACCRRSVKIAEDRPCADAFCISIASSSESNGIRYITGAKVSCCTMGQSFSARMMVGATKLPLPSSTFSPVIDLCRRRPCACAMACE